MRVRRSKYDRLLAAGIEPYPVGFARTATAEALRARYADLPADTSTGSTVAITGRVVFKRDTGKLCFATLRDGAGRGADLQVMLSLDKVGAEALAAWKTDVDLGDQVGVSGEVITSRRGELSVLADLFVLTAKALRPPPVAHRALSEESRVRQRYVDLWLRPAARRLAETRVAVVRSIRETLQDKGFLEVETPMLQVVHGGATARPFTTHMNAFDLDLSLRIAPELFLKRCVVGGLEKVFEINRNFRNEGVDATHSPEFAMLEAYEAYGDYDTMATLTRELVLAAARAAHGDTTVPRPDGSSVELDVPWPSVTLHAAVSAVVGTQVTPGTPPDALRQIAVEHGLEVADGASGGEIALLLFDKLVEHTLHAPTFVRDYPVEVRPLTRAHRDDPRLTESWDLIVFGTELATAYSELVDPVVQRERLVAQSLRAAGGDQEAMALDEDFLRALEVGMPPSGGMGMGIDRLLMTLTGATTLRETQLFPLVKPES
ncbi:MAG TPA: lysine--tRNA ligase [Mycobacteriales bacterium]|nr:lysine--tRNA ligase [Mycobacteriales bacterium]